MSDFLGINIREHEFSYFHQQAGVVFQLLESLRLRYLLEILYQVVLAELFEFISLVAVGIYKQIAYIIIIHIVHQSVLAEVFETLEHVLISKTE